MDIFLWDLLFFLLDKCFVFKSTLLCCIYLFDWCFFLRFTLLFVFSFFYIYNYLFWFYFSFGWLILLSDLVFVVYCSIDFSWLIDCMMLDRLIAYCSIFFRSSTMFSNIFLYYFCVWWFSFSQIFFVEILCCVYVRKVTTYFVLFQFCSYFTLFCLLIKKVNSSFVIFISICWMIFCSHISIHYNTKWNYWVSNDMH